MNATLFLIAAAALSAPQVVVSTLDGEQQSGTLQSISADTLVLQGSEQPLELPVARLLDVQFSALPGTTSSPPATAARVHLVDGSQLACTGVNAAGTRATLVSVDLGSVDLPISQVANLRFRELDPETEKAWNELLARDISRDRLVIRKGAVLDHLDGVVGEITDASLKFLVDGQEVSVKRNEKLFGVIYARQPATPPKAKCEARLASTELARLKSIAWNGEQLEAELTAGARVVIDPARVQSLDFSLGKIRYLSQMEPRDVQYTPFFDITWEYRRDRNQDAQPLSLRGKIYTRGLWIHSKSVMRYRLGKEYQRFQAAMGIDDLIAESAAFPANSPRGDVHVVISGDGKTLLEADVRGTDEPQTVDLDVADVRELEILVDFGSDLDTGDHLVLGDARVIK